MWTLNHQLYLFKSRSGPHRGTYPSAFLVLLIPKTDSSLAAPLLPCKSILAGVETSPPRSGEASCRTVGGNVGDLDELRRLLLQQNAANGCQYAISKDSPATIFSKSRVTAGEPA